MKPKISVIVPVYNVEKFLPDCIESLLAQTYENLELIFVNDASPDNSGKILEEYKGKYPEKIQVIHLEENIRQGGARNKGLEIATGEYIGFVDSDDYVFNDMYETLYKAISKSNADISGIYCATLPEDVSYSDLDKYAKDLTPTLKIKDDVLKMNGQELDDKTRSYLIVHSFGGIWSRLYKKSFLEETGVWFPEKVAYEDNYWLRIVLSYLNKIEIVPEIKYIYRTNSASTTRKKINYSDRIAMERKLYYDAKERGLLNLYKEAYEYSYLNRGTISTSMLLLSRCMPPKVKLVKELYRDLKEKYPNWQENVYYLTNSSKEERQHHLMMLEHPWRYFVLSILWKLNAFRRNIVKKICG